jgi:hypothetical protein
MEDLPAILRAEQVRALFNVSRGTFAKMREAGALDAAIVRIKGLDYPRYRRTAILQMIK